MKNLEFLYGYMEEDSFRYNQGQGHWLEKIEI